MRACFLGQNICALGFGVAMLQTPPLLIDEQTGKPLDSSPPQRALDENGTPALQVAHTPCNNFATHA